MEAIAFELPISVEDYLQGEDKAECRHEYLNGFVRAMAGEKKQHNRIALNLASAINDRIRGGKCRVFMENVKVFPFSGALKVMAACDPRDVDDRYCRFPKLLIEAASESIEAKDRVEKLLAYLQNETLEEYLISAQDRPEAAMHRRAAGWAREELRSISLTLTLRQVYEGVFG